MRNFTQRIAKLLAQEDGDVALVDWRGNVLSTIVALICTLVFPAACVLGQIGGPLRYARLGESGPNIYSYFCFSASGSSAKSNTRGRISV